MPEPKRELDQLDVQVALEVNKIRRAHNEAQRRLNLPVTRHERAEPGEK
jgi:hypothetical protein